jgi:bla regulator protein blaR1
MVSSRRVWADLNLAALLVLTSIPLLAQTTPAPNTSFEVASIRRGDPTDRRMGLHVQQGGLFKTENTPLRLIIQFAYDVNDYQITGGPSWMSSDPFTIEAKPETPIAASAASNGVRSMVQALLVDRFKLAAHWELREGAVFDLVIAKGGPRLRDTDPEYHSHDLNGGTGDLTGHGASIPQLIGSLSRQLGRSIIDKTRLTGNYDFKLRYTPEARDAIFGRPTPSETATTPDSSEASIFTALQEQLGLKLESAKGPIRMLVIDRAQRPSAN